MTLKELDEHFGTTYKFKLKTGLSHTNWLYWRKLGYIPIEAQMKLEKLTDGILMADLNDLPKEKYDKR